MNKDNIYMFDIYADKKLILQIKQKLSNNKCIEIIDVKEYVNKDEIQEIEKKITKNFGNRFNEILSNCADGILWDSL